MNINANEHFMVWSFFNYMLFAAVQSSTGKQVPVYGQWSMSPVPHITEQIFIGIAVLGTALLSVWLFIRSRKQGTLKKEYFSEKNISVLRETSETEKIRPEKEFDETIPVDKTDEWEKIGFHRQLSGFLKLYFLMMILIIPQLLISSMIMPQFLNPYPQSSGWYSYTLHFFEAIWLIFDMGFNYAIIKFFAQNRIEHPEKAYHYVQLFVWWQILSGVVQIGFMAFVGSIVLGSNKSKENSQVSSSNCE